MTGKEMNGLLEGMDLDSLFDLYYATEKKITQKNYD